MKYTPSSAEIGSLSKKSVCIQCVGRLIGPVLKLMTRFSSRSFSPGLTLALRLGGGLPAIGHTSARVTSPSLMSLTGVSGGRGSLVVVKNVSKYSTSAWILVRMGDVDVSENVDENSS